MMMASRMIGLVWIEREPPAASITASSESEFMPLSVCVAPICSANGMHQVEHRRNERCRQREEGDQRLAGRGQQIDVDQHLRDQHHHRRRRQGHQRQRQRPPENVPLEQIHRAFKGNACSRKQRAPRRVRRRSYPSRAAAWNVRLAKIAETNVVNVRFGFSISRFSFVFPNAWRSPASAARHASE